MNKKGQTLVVLIILLPILIAILSLVIDVGTFTYENIKLKSVTKTILLACVRQNITDEAAIRQLYRQNKINPYHLQVKFDSDQIKIKHEYLIKSIFGRLLQIKFYEARVEASIDKNTAVVKFK